MKLKKLADQYNQQVEDSLETSSLVLVPPLKRYKKTIYLPLPTISNTDDVLSADTYFNLINATNNVENSMKVVHNNVEQLNRLDTSVNTLKEQMVKVTQELADLTTTVTTLGWI